MEFYRPAAVLLFLCEVSVYSREMRSPPTRRGPYYKRMSESRLEDVARALRDDGCGNKPADIVFCLDGSSSIWNRDFKRQLTFVTDVVREFDVGRETTHIGVLTFATTVSMKMDLNYDAATIISEVKNIQQLGGETYTDLALEEMLTMFQSHHSRRNVPQIGIVITDGHSTSPDDTTRVVNRLKAAGLTMFAIGVGSELLQEANLPATSETELNRIASDPEHVFRVESYGEPLNRLKSELADKACEATTPAPTTTPRPQMIPGCDGQRPLDVLFSIPDEAGIIDTDLSLAFVQQIVDGTKIGPTQVQVGLTPRLCGDYEGIMLKDEDEKSNLKDAIAGRSLQSTQLSLQLGYLLRPGFTEAGGARPFSKKAAIMVVDNRSEDPTETQLLATDAKGKGITIITVGVGRYVDQNELTSVATSPEHAFFVDDYNLLMSLTDEILRKLCTGNTQPPPQMIEGCDGRSLMDVWLAAPDESGIRQTQNVISFMQNVVENFRISDTQVQVGVTPRMCRDLHGFGLNRHVHAENLKQAISGRRLVSTITSQQLEFVIRGFAPGEGARPGSKKFVLLMVDNVFADPQLTFSLARELQEAGVTVIVVGIGPYAQESDLVRVASSREHLFIVDDYQNLDSILTGVEEAFCRAISN